MFPKRLEVFDPDYPPIFYFTNNSVKSPKSVLQHCLPNNSYSKGFKTRKVMLIFALLYTIFLFYIALIKPQFAIDYSNNEARHAVFGGHNFDITASISSTDIFKKETSLILTLKNTSKQKTTINIESVMINKKIKLLDTTKNYILNSEEIQNVYIPISITDPKKNKVTLNITANHITKKLVVTL